MTEYELSYTGAEVNEKLGMVDTLSSQVSSLNIPTKTSELTNDSGFLTSVPSEYVTETELTAKGYATQTSVDNLSEEIVDLEENKANILDVKAWIIQQTPLFAESKEWLDANGVTSNVYILDGEIYAWIYKESTEPPYTNQIPISTDTDRQTVFGYKNGFRLNSSGVQTSCTGMMVTGFIPCKAGDVIRIKGVKNTTSSYGQNLCFYDSTNKYLGYTVGTKTLENFVAAGCTTTTDADGDIFITINTSSIKDASTIATCDSFRFACGDFTDAIITVNEEIVGGGSSGGYGWHTTGHTFVPANYEDRIIAIERAIENGDIGGRLAIASIVESTEDGGENIITFSDGRTLTVKNGNRGSKGQNGSNGQDGTVQIEPLFAKNEEWLEENGGTGKLYILPDNYVYAYTNGSWRSTGNQFVSSGESSVQKYLSDRNTYIAPVPSGYCESLNEYTDTGVQIAQAVNFEMMNNNFRTLASTYPDYITETLLGKDASNTYDIYKYELDLNPAISEGYTSVVNTNKPVFIITSGLHGNEKDPVHEVYHFMKDLCENFMESEHLEYLRNNVKFVIVPISNPWGFVNHTYNNSNDVNLNKNFEHGFSYVASTTGSSANTGANAYSEAETVLLKGVFDEYKDAVFHLECHGKVSVDNAWNQVIWFSLMKSLSSELVEICSNNIVHQIGRRLYKLGFNTSKSEGGYITYYPLNGRPKDYTATEYGMLSCTMEGTGRMGVAGHTTYTKHEQRINCEALENFVLRVLDSLNSRVEI